MAGQQTRQQFGLSNGEALCYLCARN
jgi:hypothetical protein